MLRYSMAYSAIRFVIVTTVLMTQARGDGGNNMIVGVNTHIRHWNDEAIPPAIAEAGFTWIRDGFYWQAFEKEKGVYLLPEDYARWIDNAHNAGLNIVAIFNGSNDLYVPDTYNPDAYAKAAAEFAKATKGKVQAIEILNEPANFGFTKQYGGNWNGYNARTGETDAWVAKYVVLLNAAAKAIKEVNPDVKVIGLGSATPVNIRQLMIGIAPEVDGIAEHPYSFRMPPEVVPFNGSPSMLKRDGIIVTDEAGSFASMIENYRKVSREYNGPLEIWLTEWGWTTYHEAESGKAMYAPVTEMTQAKYTIRRLYECLGLGVEATFIYDFRNDYNESPFNAEANFGLVKIDLSPKPALAVVSRFIETTKDFIPIDDEFPKLTLFPEENRPDRYPIVWDEAELKALAKITHYRFSDSEGNAVVAVWSTERAAGDLNPIVSDVEIHSDVPIKSVVAEDTLTGEKREIPFVRNGEKIIITEFSIPDYPLLLTLM